MEASLRLRSRSGALCVAFLCMFLLLGAVVSVTQGEQYLDEKEKQLASIAEAVRNNDAQKCELLKTCTTATCSRNTCLPVRDDAKRYSCTLVTYNKYCNATVAGCKDKSFDYTRSFVRTAIDTDFSSTLTTIGTCAQRALDPVFQKVSKPESLLRLYFGSNDGSWRGFPGSDQNVDDPECSTTKYDPVLRPWYRTSTSVPKAIVVLIDKGQTMNNEILQGQGTGSLLQNAKTMVAKFLLALNSGDFVNIIMFSNNKATPLSPKMVQVQVSSQTLLPELDALTENLAVQTAEDALPGASDVVQGIDAALDSFGTNYLDAAKIILIFSDTKFAASGNNISLPVTNLTALNVKVIVYKIPPINDDKLFIDSSDPFANQLCAVGGSFEVISKLSGLSNPLLALNSFFTFTAALHTKVVNNSADYSPVYLGYEQIEGNITTMSIAVFRGDGTLLGVVGMDIPIDNLGSLADSVRAAIFTRSVGRGFKTSNFLLTKADCSLQTALPSAEPCNTSVAGVLNGGFCSRTDQTSKITDLACCGSCKPAGGPKGLKTGAIVGIALAVSIPVLIICLLLGTFLWRRRRNDVDQGGDVNIDQFPGDHVPNQNPGG